MVGLGVGAGVDLTRPGVDVWRNGRDSNPRAFRPAAFKAAAIVHSATVPLPRIPGTLRAPRRGARAAEWGALLRR